LTLVFNGFPQSLQANAGIMPRPLPSRSSPVQRSSTVVPYDARQTGADEASPRRDVR
jgi:hypothetical protein